MVINIFKSILHNIGVIIVGFIFAFIGSRFDVWLGIPRFGSLLILTIGWILIAMGFLLRVWATYYFYEQDMDVIVLRPQKTLITSGPFSFSRNPLYLGGNVFIFFGAVFVLGSPSGIVLTILAIFATDIMIRREEKQLAQSFGDQWTQYKKRVRRWV